METRRQTGQKIEILTEEVLIEIFKFLPANDIESAAKVCKRWHIIITNCSKLVKKPQLVFEVGCHYKLDEALERSNDFPFRNITFGSFVYKEEFNEILMDHKDHFEQLKIENYKKKFLIHLLNETGINEKLTTLELYYDNEKISASASDPKFDFPNLKHLSVSEETSFIDLIRSHKIESLDVHNGIHANPNISKNEIWKEFLKTCTNLKRLSVYEFFAFDISTYDFKIESFEISKDDWLKEEKNIKKFLLAQRETLKKLAMRQISDEIFHVVINELKIENFWTSQQLESSTVKNLKVNSTIKVAGLGVRDDHQLIPELYGKLFKCLTEVEDFRINFSTGCSVFGNVLETLNFIAPSMIKLKKLQIKLYIDFYLYLRSNSMGNSSNDQDEVDLKIEQVEKLHLEVNSDFNQRIKLLTCCPNVKNLSIQGNLFKSTDLKAICSLKNLEELSIRGEPKLTPQVINLMLASKIRKITIIRGIHELPEKLRKSRIQTVLIEPDHYDETDTELESESKSESESD